MNFKHLKQRLKAKKADLDATVSRLATDYVDLGEIPSSSLLAYRSPAQWRILSVDDGKRLIEELDKSRRLLKAMQRSNHIVGPYLESLSMDAFNHETGFLSLCLPGFKALAKLYLKPHPVFAAEEMWKIMRTWAQEFDDYLLKVVQSKYIPEHWQVFKTVPKVKANLSKLEAHRDKLEKALALKHRLQALHQICANEVLKQIADPTLVVSPELASNLEEVMTSKEALKVFEDEFGSRINADYLEKVNQEIVAHQKYLEEAKPILDNLDYEPYHTRMLFHIKHDWQKYKNRCFTFLSDDADNLLADDLIQPWLSAAINWLKQHNFIMPAEGDGPVSQCLDDIVMEALEEKERCQKVLKDVPDKHLYLREMDAVFHQADLKSASIFLQVLISATYLAHDSHEEALPAEMYNYAKARSKGELDLWLMKGCDYLRQLFVEGECASLSEVEIKILRRVTGIPRHYHALLFEPIDLPPKVVKDTSTTATFALN